MVTTQIDSRAGVVSHRASGELSLREIRETFQATVRDPAFRSGMRVLWDLREATLTSLDEAGIRSLLELNSRYQEERGAGRSAIVVSRDVDYGIARMFQTYAEDLPWETRVYRDHAEAVAWITGAEAAGGR